MGLAAHLACAGCGLLALWAAVEASPLAGIVCLGLSVAWWAAAACCWELAADQKARSKYSGSSVRTRSARVRAKLAMMTACCCGQK